MYQDCLRASLAGIEAVRNEPGKTFCARYDENGRELACYTLFAIIPHDKEEQLHEAIRAILWPGEDGVQNELE